MMIKTVIMTLVLLRMTRADYILSLMIKDEVATDAGRIPLLRTVKPVDDMTVSLLMLMELKSVLRYSLSDILLSLEAVATTTETAEPAKLT